MDELEEVREAALTILGRRAHSRSDLRRKLLQKGFPPAVVELCLERLAAVELVDDRAYAYNLALRRAEAGRYGSSRVRRELLARGVDPETADEALARVFSAAAAEDSLARALRELTRGRGVPSDRNGRARLIRQMTRRGFSLSRVIAVLEQSGVEREDLPGLGEDEDHDVD